MIIIFWMLFCIFSAILAKSKGRSVLGWGFAGLLLGPFGLLVGLMPTIHKTELGLIEKHKDTKEKKMTESQSKSDLITLTISMCVFSFICLLGLVIIL